MALQYSQNVFFFKISILVEENVIIPIIHRKKWSENYLYAFYLPMEDPP